LKCIGTSQINTGLLDFTHLNFNYIMWSEQIEYMFEIRFCAFIIIIILKNIYSAEVLNVYSVVQNMKLIMYVVIQEHVRSLSIKTIRNRKNITFF